MTIRCIALCVALAGLAGCEPVGGGAGAGRSAAEQAEYERHKANRDAYMYQGL